MTGNNLASSLSMIRMHKRGEKSQIYIRRKGAYVRIETL